MKKKTAQKHKKKVIKQEVKTLFSKQRIHKLFKQWSIPLSTVLVIVALVGAGRLFQAKQVKAPAEAEPTPIVNSNPSIIPLPQPDYKSTNSVESMMRLRRSRRTIKPDGITLKQLGQVLWAAQGVTTDWGGRTTPSAKSTYPLTVYAMTTNVEGLENGLYQYIPGERLPAHQLLPQKLGDFGETLHKDVNQGSLKDAPAVIIVTGNMKKMADAFGGTRSDQAVYLEAGHAAQNMYLQVESLKLGMVVLNGFDQSIIRGLFTIPAEEDIIYLIPLGYPKE